MSYLVGLKGEDLACQYLKQLDYLIIKRNVKISYYEIDIIAQFQKKICFIEVKTKSDDNKLWDAENLINNRKMKNFKKAVLLYCQKNRINLNDISVEIITINNIKSNHQINIYRDII